MTMEKDVKKLVEGYEKYTWIYLRVKKTPGALVATLNKSYLEEPDNVYKYRSFMEQLICYTTNVRRDMTNAARELAVHMSHPGPENWKSLGQLLAI